MKTYRDIENLQQIDNKNLYIGDDKYLVSYKTIVGVLVAGTWLLTTDKYSVTTSRQMTQFASNHTCKRVSQAELETYLQD
jgi:hypothetical protein